MYSFTLPSISALDGVVCQRHAPPALPPGKTRHPLYRRLGGHQCRSGRVRKILPTSGFEPRIVQPIASHYTDWAISCTCCNTFLIHIFTSTMKMEAKRSSEKLLTTDSYTRVSPRDRYKTLFMWYSAVWYFSSNLNSKVKVEFTLQQATKAPSGSRGIALLFL